MVEISDVQRMLGEHPFFQDMPADVRQVLVGCAANERFAAGEMIFREGEAADRFYLIRHGQVGLELRVPGQPPLVVGTLEAGEVLGWSWLVPPFKWIMDARARTLVRALSLDATCLRGKCESDHSVGYELYKRFIPVMSRRLLAGRLQLADIYSRPNG
jgi:CRP-like cAMP-binding protein